jgi:exosortase/archaeosortase family protein
MESRLKRVAWQKKTFTTIFIVLALVLALMPFITTFNDLLTRAIMGLNGYRFIREVIVPWEVRMVGVILLPFGFEPAIFGEYLAITKGETPFLVEIVWNCIGWQSLLFFAITALVGLQGDQYTNLSKLKALVIGLLGTFLVNLFRIAAVALSAYYLGQNVAIIFHDYGSTLAVLAWLFFFWWFSYAFVLEERRRSVAA